MGCLGLTVNAKALSECILLYVVLFPGLFYYLSHIQSQETIF